MSIESLVQRNYYGIHSEDDVDDFLNFILETESLVGYDLITIKRITKVARHILNDENEDLIPLLERIHQYHMEGVDTAQSLENKCFNLSFTEEGRITMMGHMYSHAGFFAEKVYDHSSDFLWADVAYENHIMAAATLLNLDPEFSEVAYFIAANIAEKFGSQENADKKLWKERQIHALKSRVTVSCLVTEQNAEHRALSYVTLAELADDVSYLQVAQDFLKRYNHLLTKKATQSLLEEMIHVNDKLYSGRQTLSFFRSTAQLYEQLGRIRLFTQERGEDWLEAARRYQKGFSLSKSQGDVNAAISALNRGMSCMGDVLQSVNVARKNSLGKETLNSLNSIVEYTQGYNAELSFYALIHSAEIYRVLYNAEPRDRTARASFETRMAAGNKAVEFSEEKAKLTYKIAANFAVDIANNEPNRQLRAKWFTRALRGYTKARNIPLVLNESDEKHILGQLDYLQARLPGARR